MADSPFYEANSGLKETEFKYIAEHDRLFCGFTTLGTDIAL